MAQCILTTDKDVTHLPIVALAQTRLGMAEELLAALADAFPRGYAIPPGGWSSDFLNDSEDHRYVIRTQVTAHAWR